MSAVQLAAVLAAVVLVASMVSVELGVASAVQRSVTKVALITKPPGGSASPQSAGRRSRSDGSCRTPSASGGSTAGSPTPRAGSFV